MTDKTNIHDQHDQIMATIANLNAQTAKYLIDSKYEWLKVVAYVVATFTAAFFLAFKVAGII